MNAIALFNGEGNFSPDKLADLCEPIIELAKKDRTFLFRLNSPKFFLSEVYSILKKKGDLPELKRERKKEIWEESKGDKLLAFSLYLIEII